MNKAAPFQHLGTYGGHGDSPTQSLKVQSLACSRAWLVRSAAGPLQPLSVHASKWMLLSSMATMPSSSQSSTSHLRRGTAHTFQHCFTSVHNIEYMLSLSVKDASSSRSKSITRIVRLRVDACRGKVQRSQMP